MQITVGIVAAKPMHRKHWNRLGFRGGYLVTVKPEFRSSRLVAVSSLPQPRPVECTQSAPAVGGG
jgi:hypothetical protein